MIEKKICCASEKLVIICCFIETVDGSVMGSGYDSDVALEKGIDYVAKIYATSTRNMSGTKPHLQHRELPVEER